MATKPDAIRVLHVDDDEEFLELAREYLVRYDEDLRITTAGDVGEGLDVLTEREIDCIVSDYDMSGRSGIDFLETIREDHPDLPFVLFTGKGSEDIASRSISAGVTDYLQKRTGVDQFAILANRIHNAVESERAKAAAERSRDRLRTLSEAFPDVVFYVDEEGRYLDVLAGEASGLLYSDADSLIGRTFHDVLPAGTADRILDAVERTLATGECRTIEYGLEVRAGHRRFEARTAPLETTQADRRGVVLVARNVTDRTERERDLERYETIVEATGDLVYVADDEGRFTYVNDAFLERTGYRTDEVLGEHASLVLDEEHVERAEGIIRSLLASGGARDTFEMALRTADGDRIPCEAHVTVLSIDGDLGGTVGIIRDVSRQKARERKIRALHEQTRRLLKADGRSAVAELVVDAASEILGFDTNAVRLLDDAGAVLEPVAVSDAALESLGERPAYRVGEGGPGEAFERGEPLVYDDVRERGDDTDLGPVRSAMYIPIGPYGVVSITDTAVGSYDDSDRALAETLVANAGEVLRRLDRERTLEEREAELRRKNERLEEFSSIVSHDLRNPVSVIEGHLDLAREDCESHHLDAMQRALGRMTTLIDDLLTLAQEGDAVAELEPVDLAALVETCWETVGTERATLVVDTDAVVGADRTRLRQVVENLLLNAVEHGVADRAEPTGEGATSDDSDPGGADVTITVGDLVGGEGFYVADDGPGIPEAQREDVFESGYSTAPGGSGLGLAIVSEVVEAHGWRIRATDGPGSGARFEIDVTDRTA